ncbi:MAG: hypothetical protein PHW14_01800 [Candidatus Omnitrophica bacterium]|nr:hypothetical protein [Candidatus Omnitrophota bacterium]
MILGVLLIICGVMIALFPPLLSLIAAVVLIMSGIFVLTLARSYRKASRRFNDPFIDVLMKF